jgi:hypothetical protein
MLSLALAAVAQVATAQGVLVSDAGALIAGKTLPALHADGAAPSAPGPLAPPTLMPGWPVTITTHGSFHPNRNVTLADLDGDARLEIIRPSTDGQVYVFRHDGTALPGWPRAVTGWCQIAPWSLTSTAMGSSNWSSRRAASPAAGACSHSTAPATRWPAGR